jgi:hydrogenase expression/formation protein HypD
MRFLSEYRDPELLKILAGKINSVTKKDIQIMEICGSQTHTILKYCLEELLPDNINLVHGPGCPVCVTPPEFIDAAISISQKENFVIATYGDMLRVPGSNKSLLTARSEGADVRIIYSPLDAVKIAEVEKEKTIILFAIGFETTAPANASAVINAKQKRLKNFFMISSHVLIPPAVKFILSSGRISLDGLLAPGHVCSVTGYQWCVDISNEFNIPITVTGFEPADILEGILYTSQQIISGKNDTINQYNRVVNKNGNPGAVSVISRAFEICDRNWRGLGVIPGSGLDLRSEYSDFDALKVFDVNVQSVLVSTKCISGSILQGIKKPEDCSLFGSVCTPENPAGASMVSSEGACAAYFRYRKQFI